MPSTLDSETMLFTDRDLVRFNYLRQRLSEAKIDGCVIHNETGMDDFDRHKYVDSIYILTGINTGLSDANGNSYVRRVYFNVSITRWGGFMTSEMYSIFPKHDWTFEDLINFMYAKLTEVLALVYKEVPKELMCLFDTGKEHYAN